MTAIPKPLPPLSVLNQLFLYHPDSGVIFNRKTRRRADRKSDNSKIARYKVVEIEGKVYRAHRIAWLMCTGEDPGKEWVRHLDGNASNNASVNLGISRVIPLSEFADYKHFLGNADSGITASTLENLDCQQGPSEFSKDKIIQRIDL